MELVYFKTRQKFTIIDSQFTFFRVQSEKNVIVILVIP